MLLSFNIHPQQVADASAPFTSWDEESVIRSRYQVMIEIPESLVCHTDQMARWVERIRKLGMLVAYDDFGKGQSRITDLLQVPPDFLKLDRSLIADLQAEPAKQTIVRAVVDACRSLQVKTIGEGVETEQEWRACLDAGIDYGQGYLFGKPMPAYQLLDIDTSSLPPHCPFVRLKLV
jgi:EAL domain-containing protein (putative c-di-GMP-specific phosphodiesterase class I)